MSAKVKLITCVVGMLIAIGMLVVGVIAATQQNIVMQGNVNFDIPNKTLYVNDVRLQQSMSETPQTVPGFRKGYINDGFNLNLANANFDINTTGTFVLYFDIINLIVDGQTVPYTVTASWSGSPVPSVEFSLDPGSEKIAKGTVTPIDRNDSTPLSGTIVLEVNVYDGQSFDLSNILLTFEQAFDSSKADYIITEGNNITIDSYTGGESNVVIPGSFSIVDGELVDGDDYTVTSVGDNIFTNNTNITTVTLPDTITSIGSSAFQNCSNLTTINLPEGLTEIGENAFHYCSRLTDIVLPDTLTTIGDSAFYNCYSISGTLNIPASVSYIGKMSVILLGLTEFTVDAGSQYFTAVDGVLYSKDMTRLLAYPRSKSTTNFVVPNEVLTIDQSAFRACTGLRGTLTLSPYLTTMGTEVFFGCSNLNGDLSIPASLTSMGAGVFAQCMFSAFNVDPSNSAYMSENGVLYNKSKTNLIHYPAGSDTTSFTLSSTVKDIQAHGFFGAASLQSVVLPENLQSIGNFAFYNSGLSGDIVLPSSITSIGSGIFAYTTVNSISIDNAYYKTIDGVLYNAAVTELLQYPNGNTNNESFIIPNTVNTIGDYSLAGSMFSSVTIPASVTTIKGYAFSRCTNLTTVIVESSSVAAMLSSKSAVGLLLNNATTVYVSESAASSLPEAFANIFIEDQTDMTGYRKYLAL